ncbi:uncharacterized protein UTRI_06020 [Ustilago trichophora]|uniref:Uncharacterized protein n=1 Tax=Ustilago trichophora TaxID=86804 RepID=A0A5C3EL01_9BASI|nr:uncharacterized protein UTRI_06020 [Ustilago trichophora]
MFGDAISRSPQTPSPWSTRLSTSASTSASTTAPPTPPSNHPFGDSLHQLTSSGGAEKHQENTQLPALHLLNMSCDDALSDLSDEADGFFSLDMDVSIDQQLKHHDHTHAIPSLVTERFDSSSQQPSRDTLASPSLNPAVRRASETVAYSSSPLERVGLDPIIASRSRNSPVFNADHITNASTNANVDTRNASTPSAFGPIAPEVDQKGNLEYKLKILPPSRERFDRLVTQLKWRLLEGAGLAVYEIGVLDDGTLIGLDPDSMKDSLKLLSLMAAEVGAICYVQRVLALEKVATPIGDHHDPPSIALPQHSAPPSRSSASRLTAAESDLSLRALPSTEAIQTLQPYIYTSEIDDDTRSHLLQSGAAGLYRFDIAEQQTSIPPRLVSDAPHTAIASIAAVDPTQAAPISATDDDAAEVAMSAQTKRRLLKATNSLPSSKNTSTSTNASTPRPKKDILQGRHQSEIVYLPSKEEKRILRAAAAVADAEMEAAINSPSPPTAPPTAVAVPQNAAERALSHTQAHERKMMAKMAQVADSVQPKTARARARARKIATSSTESSAATTTTTTTTTTTMPSTHSASPSPVSSPAIKAVSMPNNSKAAYTGYENVMSNFGVLSERAARTLSAKHGMDAVVKARLIVEAVVRREVDSEHTPCGFSAGKG